nr:SDR family oxidoreductase [Halomonas socia]
MEHATQRTAIVTGASRGIGRAIALRLAADGLAVTVNYAGNTAKAEETVAAIEANGGRSIAIQGDVADPQDVERLFSATQEAFGRIDVVVNSAGIMHMATIGSDTLSAFDETIATNLRGRQITVNAVAPGPVATELFPDGKSGEQVAQLAALPPLERLGQPDDIAGTVAFGWHPSGNR